MLYFKFSLLFLLLSANTYAEKFTSDECLKSTFKTEIKHDGKFFGLIENHLKLKKDKCLLEIQFKNILETTWKIDICREPIHLKVKAKGTESFYKRTKECGKVANEFCSYWADLKENIQDFGLIYAQGERESLKTAHGQTYCSYLLLQRYLDDAMLFSMHETAQNIFGKLKKEKKIEIEISSESEVEKKKEDAQMETPTSLVEQAKESIEENKTAEEDDRPRF